MSGVKIVKVKITLVQALRLCTGRTAHRGSKGIALPFHDHGTRKWWGVSVTPRPLFTPGKDPVPIVQEAGWVRRPVWTGAENLAPARIRSPDHPARNQSLCRLSYPAHYILWSPYLNIKSRNIFLNLMHCAKIPHCQPNLWSTREAKETNIFLSFSTFLYIHIGKDQQ